VVLFVSASSAHAQLPAFPGAEGAAQFIAGGRGGDVYHVINLNDSGDGSLRYGIQNAPTTGRTIVFDVGGTINLQSSLDFNGKDNITIAGQTAPGGGITLAGNRLRINPLFASNGSTVIDPLSNVIVQHLRVRTGAAATNGDGVWVQHSSNVIVDHVTTSWSVDESISVTHDSNDVTVQWSTMSQGLFEHSYGSLLNGGTYTYAHNLYVHNKSRNPRLQKSGSSIMELDFVNNVIYNPQDKFAYGGSEYYVNFVGNYGIRGPGTNDTNHALIRDTDSASHFYVDGNFVDNNTDGTINGFAAPLEGGQHDGSVFRTGASYTLLDSRIDIPAANVSTANQAYIQVLSRAGAINYRDAHDRDMIRNVINQQPGYISSESEWGPYPTLPGGTAPADSNQDGVPDAWAADRGFETSVPLNTIYAPSGYTYLEEYIHSLTPFAYAPTGTASHSISTAYGQGADAQLNENGGTSATSGGNGGGATLDAAWGGTAGSTNQMIALKFDLSEIVPGSINTATLELTAASAITGTHQFKVWGLDHDDADWDWDESTVQFSDAPGAVFDGNSRTLGINPAYTADGEPAERSNQPLPVPDDLFALGTLTVGATDAGENVQFDSLNLAVFLNLAAFFEGTTQEGIVTLLLEQTNNASAASFYSKEGAASFAPRLIVDALLRAVNPPILAGDYNNDGKVDAADYTVWRDALHSGAALQNETASLGIVDADDYDAWKANFGVMAELGGGAVGVVPEPGSLVLAAVALALAATRSPRRNLS
jgi:hypothetical protein